MTPRTDHSNSDLPLYLHLVDRVIADGGEHPNGTTFQSPIMPFKSIVWDGVENPTSRSVWFDFSLPGNGNVLQGGKERIGTFGCRSLCRLSSFFILPIIRLAPFPPSTLYNCTLSTYGVLRTLGARHGHRGWNERVHFLRDRVHRYLKARPFPLTWITRVGSRSPNQFCIALFFYFILVIVNRIGSQCVRLPRYDRWSKHLSPYY